MPLASCPYLIDTWMPANAMRIVGAQYAIAIALVIIFKIRTGKPTDPRKIVKDVVIAGNFLKKCVLWIIRKIKKPKK